MATELSRTSWGGLAIGAPARPGGFFRVAQSAGVWWLIDPDGGRFLSKGVNTVRFDQDCILNTGRIPYAEACHRKYRSHAAWQSAAARRLSSWGFNTLGAWSDPAVRGAGASRLALTPNLDLGASFKERTRSGGEPSQAFPDVFDVQFAAHARSRAGELCAPLRQDPSVIGWFTDNELRWGPDWRGSDELLTVFLNLPGSSPGRRAAIAFLAERYRQFDDFNAVWRTTARSWEALPAIPRLMAPYRRGTVYERDPAVERASNSADLGRAAFVGDCDAFSGALARRYFEITKAAIRDADPNHMLLGCRFAYVPEPVVLAAAAGSVDVISFNCYGFDPTAPIDAYAATGKPCINTEFSFRSEDSGLPNTIGAAPQVATQADRARCFRHYVSAGLRRPSLVGYHWFEHADQPAEGRFDGENSNYGIVTIGDEVYEDLARTMTAVNEEADEIHSVPAQLAA
ncbi:MAG TPA: agarase [Xanthobacteraceae bacterium]